MKRIIFIFFLIIALAGYSQVTDVRELRIKDSATQFGRNLPVGTKIYNLDDGKYWVAIEDVEGTETLTTASESFEQLNSDGDGVNIYNSDGTISEIRTVSIETDGALLFEKEQQGDENFTNYIEIYDGLRVVTERSENEENIISNFGVNSSYGLEFETFDMVTQSPFAKFWINPSEYYIGMSYDNCNVASMIRDETIYNILNNPNITTENIQKADRFDNYLFTDYGNTEKQKRFGTIQDTTGIRYTGIKSSDFQDSTLIPKYYLDEALNNIGGGSGNGENIYTTDGTIEEYRTVTIKEGEGLMFNKDGEDVVGGLWIEEDVFGVGYVRGEEGNDQNFSNIYLYPENMGFESSRYIENEDTFESSVFEIEPDFLRIMSHDEHGTQSTELKIEKNKITQQVGKKGDVLFSYISHEGDKIKQLITSEEKLHGTIQDETGIRYTMIDPITFQDSTLVPKYYVDEAISNIEIGGEVNLSNYVTLNTTQTITGGKTFGRDVYFSELLSKPSSPASGFGSLYVKNDKKIYFQDSSGTEYDLTLGGGGGSSLWTEDTYGISRTTGNVGIGVNSVSDELLRVSGSKSGSIMSIYNTDPSGSGLYLGISGSTGTALRIGTTEGTTLTAGKNGSFRLAKYGSGDFSGTVAKYLAVNSSGDVIETDAPAGGGSTSFIGLTDTPNSYTGQTGRYVRVNSGGNGLEFTTAPSTLWSSDANGIYYSETGKGVGIGISSPTSFLLDVSGAKSYNYAARIRNTSSFGQGLYIGVSSGGTYPALSVNSSKSDLFRVNASGSIKATGITNDENATHVLGYNPSTGDISYLVKPEGGGGGGGSNWTIDGNGINYNSGNIGIGANASSINKFYVTSSLSNNYLARFYNSSTSGQGLLISSNSTTKRPLLTVGTGSVAGTKVFEAFGDRTIEFGGYGSGSITGTVAKYLAVTAQGKLIETDAPTGGGASSFLGLSDTPASYSGQGKKLVGVNSGATALEFVYTPNMAVQTLSGNSVTWNMNNGINAKINLNAGATTVTFTNVPVGYSGNITVVAISYTRTIQFAGDYNISLSPYLEADQYGAVNFNVGNLHVLSWYYDGNYIFINGTKNYSF